MIKYRIDVESGSIEFLEFSLAETYAIDHDIPTGSIVTLDEPAPSPTPEDLYEMLVDAGFPVAGTTCSLALYDYDRSTFAGMLGMINEGLQLGQMTPDTMVTIKSQEGNILPMTAMQYKITMLQYGFYYKTIWDNKQ